MKPFLLGLMMSVVIFLALNAHANNVTYTTPLSLGGSEFFGATHTDTEPFTDTFTFTISGAFNANATIVTIAELPGSNIDFTSATLNGNAFTLSPNTFGTDTGFISLAAYTGPLTLIVNGVTDAGSLPNTTASYAGTLNARAVPEPTSLLLLGVGVLGLALWRRRLSHERDQQTD